jgi:mevalonate kinase
MDVTEEKKFGGRAGPVIPGEPVPEEPAPAAEKADPFAALKCINRTMRQRPKKAEFCTPAKWILSGEHTVTRGGKAIAFPLAGFASRFVFEENEDGCCTVTGEESLRATVLSLSDAAANFLGVSTAGISGRISVESNIPSGVGLGSSAALCVSVARLFEYWGLCGDVFALARFLEDGFHGKSSGLDIATVLENRPVIFGKNRVKCFLKPRFRPRLILSQSGEQSATSECVKIVEEFFRTNGKYALETDERMELASDLCEAGLRAGDFYQLRDGIRLANGVFRSWGLYSPAMLIREERLLEKGAVAVKPVGSGLGGYMLSLWEDNPPNNYFPLMGIYANVGAVGGKKFEKPWE